MVIKANQPIGIFDSGVGGLTVAASIVKQLPQEDIIYFGDTAHLPYGDKSTAAIQGYAIKIADMLLQQQCKLILIACNSASAAAYDVVCKCVGNKALVLNVIDPLITLLGEQYTEKHLGLIGTRQTINSNIYKHKIDALNTNIQLSSLATQVLAAIIEENFADKQVIYPILENYLSHPTLANIDALILGCTHYPIIKDRIAAFYDNRIDIIDASDVVAESVKTALASNNLLNTQTQASKTFYVSDLTPSFAETSNLFFNQLITLQHYPLWD